MTDEGKVIVPELPIEFELMPYTRHFELFLRDHSPKVGTHEHAVWIEDLRRLLIMTNVNFLLSQRRGNFGDGWGIKYLQHCLATFVPKETINDTEG